MPAKKKLNPRHRSPPDPRKVAGALLAWFPRHARDLPWRRTGDPYAIWMSEIMLQQTQVKTVLPFYRRWMAAFPDIASVARAKPEQVLKLWEGLGYYTRARNLQQAAIMIMEKHDGEFPRNFEQVLELPGIGRYTAGAICSIAFDLPTPILDGNVIRVLSRLHGVRGDPKLPATNAQLWELAQDLVLAAHNTAPAARESPAEGSRSRNCSQLNQALMELGALLCTPREPNCLPCPVRRFCRAHQAGLAETFPNLAPRQPLTARRFVAFVAHRGESVFVRQRPEGVVNARLWEFPNVEVTGKNSSILAAAEKLFGTAPENTLHLRTIRHTITRYRIALEIYRATFPKKSVPPALEGKWSTTADLKKLAFPSAHRKIVEELLSSGTKPIRLPP